MKACFLVLLTLVAVALADDEVAMMKEVVEVEKFLKEDPLGVKIFEQLQDLLAILRQARQRLRQCLADYLKNLPE
ncbi:unnamed protein product [Schistocephalus solidus]|uniref:Antigen B n=1 Tax=Schistocephalus solidus TaxID=70667 RepID=A0A183TR37_SCHSO|nr:unnamed protein product [Schistocephalus solidus]